ncbi:MAG: ISNCY family transposase, partial [Alkalinema sp. RL_2_19]|nr:ISNCY family transposase [Alkalinema sp. RL_2_19]
MPVIVAPEKETVIALMPELIRPQDGVEKQDSEIAAAKRWTHNHQAVFPSGTVTLLGDDLYSHQPMCEHCIERDFNFIFTCLPSSHESLYEWLEYLDGTGL